MDYENKWQRTLGENKPNSNPIKPNLRKAKMNLNFFSEKDYENETAFRLEQNKPNSNPIKPNLARLWSVYPPYPWRRRIQNVERLLALEQIAAIIILIIKFLENYYV